LGYEDARYGERIFGPAEFKDREPRPLKYVFLSRDGCPNEKVWYGFVGPVYRSSKFTGRRNNAFVVHSLCTPSRASFLTGQYTHRHEVMNNFTPFAAGKATHATLLGGAGYRAGY